MQDYEIISDLISEIYDAGLDHSRWISVLGRLAEFASGYSAILCLKDPMKRDGGVFYDEDKIDMEQYFERYVKLDPTTGRFFADVGIPTGSEDFIAHNELRKTRFFKECLHPQRLVDFATMVLDRSTTTATVLNLVRHERDGLVDIEMRRKMRFVLPHLRRSLLIGSTIDSAIGTGAGVADTFDRLSAGVFLVDKHRGIVHANASGHAMIVAGDVLRKVGGRLAARDPKSDQELRAVIAAASIGDVAVGRAGIAQPLVARDGERYVAHVMPLTSGARRATGQHYSAVAALVVNRVARNLPSAPEPIAKIYNLTRSELRVLIAVVQTASVPAAAEALGISGSTLRTHLRRVYIKTGATRHADLVSLAAKFSNILIG